MRRVGVLSLYRLIGSVRLYFQMCAGRIQVNICVKWNSAPPAAPGFSDARPLGAGTVPPQAYHPADSAEGS